MTVVALVGNPNCGKSTLFNALTGSQQTIGNWPGVTVEKSLGRYIHEGETFEVIDLPGMYDMDAAGDSASTDRRITQEVLDSGKIDAVVNVLDAGSLQRGLYLTSQLRERGLPVIVAVNMLDSAQLHGVRVNCTKLAGEVDCPVVPMVASRKRGIVECKAAVLQAAKTQSPSYDGPNSRYAEVDRIVQKCVRSDPKPSTVSALIDGVVLNRFLAFPAFLLVMYLLFMFTINVSSVFIDFFGIVGTAVFVEAPRLLLSSTGIPQWITTLIADGVGGGVQLVATFIPVIGCLFLFLSVLEHSGYMGRIAFILDRLMQRLGLPGKSLVPLLVGFGCNVPAVMATRGLDSRADRVLTTVMAPYMSCGARLTVYVLFAAAFFPDSGQNIVFSLYLIGLAVAIGSAWVVRKSLLPQAHSSFALELPAYHLPTLRGVLTQTGHRLKGFVVSAGKAIVLVVIALNFVNSIGVDGSFGNENREKSVLSAIGRTITPMFAPMGIDEDNWPATVGIFTGMFAKEVVVGTLDALYSPSLDESSHYDFGGEIKRAMHSIPANLSGLGDTLSDPLGIKVDPVVELERSAAEQQVELDTIHAMRNLFHGQQGAYSYLLFILLYMPCVATIGVIFKELGKFWAVFTTIWSVVLAYGVATLFYQMGELFSTPVLAGSTIAIVLAAIGMLFSLLILWGRYSAPESPRRIPLVDVTRSQ